MLTEATKKNLLRKSGYIDKVQMHNGYPLFSWVDLSLTELCNRACVFCPRVDPSFYPNQPLHMSLTLVDKIANELHGLDYEGVVVLCGFGEPMLHPELGKVVQAFGNIRVEIVTNGDHLTADNAKTLYRAGVDYFVVSCYDGPHQINPFHEVFKQAKVPDTAYILRDRWHTEEDDFGLKLTNRGGTVSIGNQDDAMPDHPCHYLAYQLTIDWNGDVLLCVQDWHKKKKYGNVSFQTMEEIWTSSHVHKKRMQLIAGKRRGSPCEGCNCDGTLHGHEHVKSWTAK